MGHKSSVFVGRHLLLFSRVVWRRRSCLHQESSALDRKFFLENFCQFLSLPGVIQKRLSSFCFAGVIMIYWRSFVG